ncbi:VOC family protein [Amycolatopsis sp. NBC_00438]|uniref:VOC family protein n=1 Tax=Amycolatopsis sp. NBC_00438 TaxID=2903558 RepID=UPI002E1CD58A
MTDMKLEIAVLPVSDVDRAKRFYLALGWREDADFAGDGGFRVIQLTPPGSPASVIFGSGVTDAAPGSAQGLHLVVTDIETTRAEIAARGVGISEVFHDAGGVFHHAGTGARVDGPDPDRHSYASFASFSDPDGNGWVLQEITTRLPGRVTDVRYSSAAELADALRRAARAHGEHEKELGHEDTDWPSWYAEYMVQHGPSAG